MLFKTTTYDGDKNVLYYVKYSLHEPNRYITRDGKEKIIKAEKSLKHKETTAGYDDDHQSVYWQGAACGGGRGRPLGDGRGQPKVPGGGGGLTHYLATLSYRLPSPPPPLPLLPTLMKDKRAFLTSPADTSRAAVITAWASYCQLMRQCLWR